MDVGVGPKTARAIPFASRCGQQEYGHANLWVRGSNGQTRRGPGSLAEDALLLGLELRVGEDPTVVEVGELRQRVDRVLGGRGGGSRLGLRRFDLCHRGLL